MPEDRVPRLHDDEADIDADLVAALVATQFPQWSGRRPRAVASSGTDHVTFRLGTDLAVRMPRTAGTAGQAETDRLWLPKLASHLPLPVPEPLALGRPDRGYPYTWGVYRWLEGEPVTPETGTDPRAAADLAAFIRALRSIDADGAPAPTDHPFSRGTPLAPRDPLMREALEQLGDVLDVARVAELWQAALAAAHWTGAPVWIHGDLLRGNVLAHGGRLSAVIDFGTLRAADPAGDLLPAWQIFDGAARKVFRAEVDVDDDTWLRGLGWALSLGIISIPYYRERSPERVRGALRVIEAILADCEA
jgi:aminoglycoside phosphotransferase (APT) family kinase protein